MCWTTFASPVKILASKDKEVYKVVEYDGKYITSYYRGYLYELGKTYTNQIRICNSRDGLGLAIDEAFHSYIEEPKTSMLTYDPITTPQLMGLITTNDNYVKYNLRILKCIIPAGACYYVNELEEIASDTIIPIALSTKDIDTLEVDEKIKYTIFNE